VPVKLVTASRGKAVRAEPIATLYARGEVDHAGTFAELEQQATEMTTAGYMGQRSARCNGVGAERALRDRQDDRDRRGVLGTQNIKNTARYTRTPPRRFEGLWD